VAEIMGDYKIEGILFDMDGVLADVSASYRQAIILTGACAHIHDQRHDTTRHTSAVADGRLWNAAKSFGVGVSGEDVAKAKAAGDANNDWKLTRRLIEQAKPADQVVPSLDEVTAKFEEYYQGTPENAGLWTTEKLIIDKSLLEKLSAKHPLGIVTGACHRTRTCTTAHAHAHARIDWWGLQAGRDPMLASSWTTTGSGPISRPWCAWRTRPGPSPIRPP
jgi:phosphoglycolate phosphatase-like HAD superfamily hydrolase